MKIPRLTDTEAVILQLLITHGELYGLEMVKLAPRKLTRSKIYVILSRMMDKGYVKRKPKAMEAPEGEQGPPRRIYCITGHGQRVTQAWELASAACAHV